MNKALLLERLIPAMRAAGRLIEDMRANGFDVRQKPATTGTPRSPVTDADEAAERLLASAIRAIEPDATIVGEEASAAGLQPAPAPRFWLIDPLDGTKDFVSGGGDYSVNVGLVEDGVPVLGLVLHPPTAVLWAGAAGGGAFRQAADGGGQRPIESRRLATAAGPAPRIVTSRSNLDPRTSAFVAAIPGAEVRPSGSSLKFCLLAEGKADLYPRFGPTSEWDTAAADAVLRAAGGMTHGPDGQPFRYGKAGYRNGPFLAMGDAGAGVAHVAAFVARC